jgi:Ornithine carbamoyltransferase
MEPYGPKTDPEAAKQYQAKFKDWKVTVDLLEKSGNPYYMHCGPADRGQEVEDAVLDSYENSLYFDEAENRLHTEKAIMSMILP